MANRLYDKAREAFLNGDLSWLGDNQKAILVDLDDYTPDFSTDEFLSDIPLASRVATSPNLSGKDATAGVADCDDITWTAVTGDQSEAIIIFQDTGLEASSRLICYMDTAVGLPVTPNGGDITVQIDNGTNKLFKL